MLNVNAERTGDVAVVSCSGRLVRGESATALRNAVVSHKDTRVIVLDLSELEFLDAGGLGTLVSLHHWTRGRGIQLKLVNPGPFVRDLLSRTGLDRVFDVSSIADSLWVLSGSDDAQCLQRVRQRVRAMAVRRPELVAHAV
ncbi:MAG TPA: STAS domain-containing protein [Terriglobales bacterium]|nr:STAS domain-containing protein [Terriglobales bacterium]